MNLKFKSTLHFLIKILLLNSGSGGGNDCLILYSISGSERDSDKCFFLIKIGVFFGFTCKLNTRLQNPCLQICMLSVKR